ncbi:MAG: type IV pilin-like G/H family protein [Halothece sp. Uz-M2-17]|nr:type IV pilin-like G/H family protein [Halothece sp. Uz-M2-17]
MNSNLKAKLLFALNHNKKDKGFTLIELLVVIIIIGILSAIALPNLLSQANKARQSEGKSNIGAIVRGQQAYRLEEGEFGNLGDLDVTIEEEFYATTVTASSQSAATIQANDVPQFQSDLKSYEAGVLQPSSTAPFNSVICEDSTASNTNVTASANAAATGCGAGETVN